MNQHQKATIEKFQYFLQEVPPYRTEKFSINELIYITQNDSFVIEQFCEECQKIRTFKVYNGGSFSVVKAWLQALTPSPRIRFEDEQSSGQVDKNAEFFVSLVFYCQHGCNEKHEITIFIKGETITKVGQYPTFSKIEVEEGLKKYKNVISKYYPELTKSVSCYSQNLGIPAFVYLRRILEHLVNEKYEKLGIADTEAKFIDKLKKVEENEEVIPEELESIKSQIYIILSKGVHEYEEEECLSLYDAVKFVIESILDKEVLKRERSKKAEEAKKAIQAKLKEQK